MSHINRLRHNKDRIPLRDDISIICFDTFEDTGKIDPDRNSSFQSFFKTIRIEKTTDSICKGTAKLLLLQLSIIIRI